MIHVCFRFTNGRYHGSRWGTHVNEADLDWPPSPWRLLRAFLAAGYRSMGWSEPPSPTALALLESLCSTTPVFALPRGATPAHTRHYLRQYKEGASAKVLDAFLHVGKDARLVATWDVRLNHVDRALLREILGHVSYLGRAESWVECELIDEIPDDLLPCTTARPEGLATPIRLLAPIDPAEYVVWREREVARALATELGRRREAALARRKPPPTTLTKAQQRRVSESIPESVIGAMSLDTGTIRKAGWSRPPGSVEQIYWRPSGAVDVAPVMVVQPAAHRSPPTCALYRLSSDTEAGTVLPALSTALRQGDRAHSRVASLADGLEHAAVLVGRVDGRPATGHEHAHFLSLCTNRTPQRSGLPSAPIDHLLVWAPGGLEPDHQQALLQLRALFPREATVSLVCVGFGDPPDLESLVPHTRAATRWRSHTPYIPPRYLKARGKNSLSGQIEAGLRQRGLPVPIRIRVETGDGWAPNTDAARRASWWRHFVLERRRGGSGRTPKQRLTFGIELTFETPVRGPLTLGYGSHFGLGLFEPVSR